MARKISDLFKNWPSRNEVGSDGWVRKATNRHDGARIRLGSRAADGPEAYNARK